jgi:hypothetical protein
VYKFTGTLTPPSGFHLRIVQPLAGRLPGDVVPYGLVYTGPSNSSGVALQLTGIVVVELDHVTIDGGGLIGTVVAVDPGSAGNFAPGGWQIENCVFKNCAAGGICFHVGGTSNCSAFYFRNTYFAPNVSTGTGLQIDNQNSVDHTMIGGSAGPGAVGIFFNNAGKLQLLGVEFANNSANDIQTNGGWLQADNCWTEGSNRFLTIGYEGFGGSPSPAFTKLSSCRIASSPFNYQFEGGGPRIANPQASDYAGIICNSAEGLIIENCQLVTNTGQANQASQMMTVFCQQTLAGLGASSMSWTNIQSFSAIPGGANPDWATQFFSLRGTLFG